MRSFNQGGLLWKKENLVVVGLQKTEVVGAEDPWIATAVVMMIEGLTEAGIAECPEGQGFRSRQ